MSARRLQQPAPISLSKSKGLGLAIVTTLAVLPQGNGADIPESNPHPRNGPPAGQPSSLAHAIPDALVDRDPSHSRSERGSAAGSRVNLFTEDSDEGACGGDTTAELPMISSVEESPDRFLAAENIIADFDGSHIPVLIQPETRTDPPNAQAIEEILKAYDEKLPVEALIEANFPEGDFQSHLIRYLRNRMRINPYCELPCPQTKLKDAYLIGLKDWCASALDAFISQIEEDLSSHGKSSEAADSKQGKKSAQWTRQFFLEQTALHQRRAMKFVGKRSFKMGDTWCWWDEWSHYYSTRRATRNVTPTSPIQAEKSDTILMLDELRFISAVLRNLYPLFFESEAKRIAHVLESFGAPCHLINLLQNMRLDPEDVVEDKHVKSSVQGAHDPEGASFISLAERGDVPLNTLHMIYPFHVLEEPHIRTAFEVNSLPPFFQAGYEAKDFKTEAIKKIVEFFECGEKDKALSVLDREFDGATDFHEHFFGFLRTAMRDYVFPKVSSGSEELEACNPYDFGTPLGEILRRHITGVQKWCARVHEGLAERLLNATIAAYKSHAEESHDLIEWARKMEMGHTRSVNALMDQIDLSLVEASPPELPETSVGVPALVARLRESLSTFSWLMQNMSWDSFLFFRTNLASLVREADGGKQGYSFLANILETLSFTEGDIDEFRKHYNEAHRLGRERWYQSQFEGPFELSRDHLTKARSFRATLASRKWR